jgi:tRNA-specific 2-thiouridylase
MKPTAAVALSGGIDSLMAAWLLKTHGYQVTGIHFITGYEAGCRHSDELAKPVDENNLAADIFRAQKRMTPIARQLNIPIRVLDVTAAFKNMSSIILSTPILAAKHPTRVCGAIRPSSSEPS